jgi:hypothetical protein
LVQIEPDNAGPLRTDPWAVPGAHRPSGARTGRTRRAVGAAALGAAGPALELIRQRWFVGALVVAVAAAVWELALRHLPRSRWWSWPVRAALAVAMPAATWSSIGRAPALVTLVGVAVADAALVEWAPIPGWPKRSVPVAHLALLPLVAGELAWIRTATEPVFAGLALVALAIVEAYHRAPTPLADLDAAVGRRLKAISSVLGAMILAPVVAIVLYLPGLIGRAADAITRRRDRPSYWRPHTNWAGSVDRAASRPFSPGRPSLVFRRHLVGVLAVLAAGALLTVTANDRLGSHATAAPRAEPLGPVTYAPTTTVTGPHATPDGNRDMVRMDHMNQRLSVLPAYRDVTWADAYQTEINDVRDHHLLTSSVGDLAMGDYAGSYTNVKDGERRSLEPPTCRRCHSATVWMIGGSAAFGIGQRDDHTIASDLVRLAAKDHIRLTIKNYSVMGITLYQDVKKIEHRLDDHEGPPDLVLFYDGWNDVAGTIVGSTVHGVHPDEPAKLSFDDWAAMGEKGLDPRTVATPSEMGRLAAAKYHRAQREISKRLDALGARALFVYQPDSLTSAFQYDAGSDESKLPPRFFNYANQAFDVAATRLESYGVVNLRHLFDYYDDPVFMDLMHQNELGARVVAARLYPIIHRRLSEQ